MRAFPALSWSCPVLLPFPCFVLHLLLVLPTNTHSNHGAPLQHSLSPLPRPVSPHSLTHARSLASPVSTPPPPQLVLSVCLTCHATPRHVLREPFAGISSRQTSSRLSPFHRHPLPTPLTLQSFVCPRFKATLSCRLLPHHRPPPCLHFLPASNNDSRAPASPSARLSGRLETFRSAQSEPRTTPPGSPFTTARMPGFGDFSTICHMAPLPLCASVGPITSVSNGVGVTTDCFARNIELANTIIFQGASSVIHILALAMTVIMILHIRGKFTAVGTLQNLPSKFMTMPITSLTLTELPATQVARRFLLYSTYICCSRSSLFSSMPASCPQDTRHTHSSCRYKTALLRLSSPAC